MSYCSKCGNQFSDGDSFCAFCGNSVVEKKQELQIQPQTQSQPSLCEDTPPNMPGRGSSIAGMILGIIGSLYGFVFSLVAIRTVMRLIQSDWYNWYEQAEDYSGNIFMIMFFAEIPVLAVVFSVLGRSKGYQTGINKSGLITGLLGLFFFIIALVIYIFI
ncbi:MAG: hypothetical protein J6L76_00825 [Clostridia bacterium]|nr:hypothetical protein [Clostridia bacterium]